MSALALSCGGTSHPRVYRRDPPSKAHPNSGESHVSLRGGGIQSSERMAIRTTSVWAHPIHGGFYWQPPSGEISSPGYMTGCMSKGASVWGIPHHRGFYWQPPSGVSLIIRVQVSLSGCMTECMSKPPLCGSTPHPRGFIGSLQVEKIPSSGT